MKIKQLYINAGNSRISAGYFMGEKFVSLGSRLSQAAAVKKINFNKFGFEEIVLASVVPGITGALKNKYPGKVFEIVSKDLPIANIYKNKNLTGIDRLLICLGALKKYGRTCVVVDFGTATTLNFITKQGEFKGGVIAPGAGMFGSYLYEKTSRLPKIKIKKINKVIGRSTQECIRSGIFFGNIEMIGGLIRRIKKEAGGKVFIAATGGWGAFFSKYIREIDKYDPELVFYGMKEIKRKC